MKLEQKKAIAINRIDLCVKNAMLSNSSKYFSFALDYIADMTVIGVLSEREAQNQYNRVMVYWQEWKEDKWWENRGTSGTED